MGQSKIFCLKLSFASVFLQLTLSAAGSADLDTVGTVIHETPIGKLVENHSIEATLAGPTGGFIGVIKIKKGEAFKINDDIAIAIPLDDKKSSPPYEITLVQDTASGQWLATDGTLCFHADGMQKENIVPMFAEGHVINITGGGTYHIEGRPFSNTVLEINGRATRKSKFPIGGLMKNPILWTVVVLALFLALLLVIKHVFNLKVAIAVFVISLLVYYQFIFSREKTLASIPISTTSYGFYSVKEGEHPEDGHRLAKAVENDPFWSAFFKYKGASQQGATQLPAVQFEMNSPEWKKKKELSLLLKNNGGGTGDIYEAVIAGSVRETDGGQAQFNVSVAEIETLHEAYVAERARIEKRRQGGTNEGNLPPRGEQCRINVEYRAVKELARAMAIGTRTEGVERFSVGGIGAKRLCRRPVKLLVGTKSEYQDLVRDVPAWGENSFFLTTNIKTRNADGFMNNRIEILEPMLIPMMNGDDVETRICAIQLIKGLGGKAGKASPDLCKILVGNNPTDLKAITAVALHAIGPAVVPDLCRILLAKENTGEDIKMICALLDTMTIHSTFYSHKDWDSKATNAIEPIMNLLKERDIPYKSLLVRLLDSIGPEAKPAAPLLRTFLKDRALLESDPDLLVSTVQALRHIGDDSQETLGSLFDLFDKSMEMALKDKDDLFLELCYSIAERGAGAMNQQDIARRHLPGLLELYEKNGRNQYETSIMISMFGPYGKDAVPVLFAKVRTVLYHTQNSFVGPANSGEILNHFKTVIDAVGPAAADYMVDALNLEGKKSPYIPSCVPSHYLPRYYLVKWGVNSIPALLKGLQSGDLEKKNSIHEIIAKIGPSAIPVLQRLGSDPVSGVYAKEALAKIRGTQDK